MAHAATTRKTARDKRGRFTRIVRDKDGNPVGDPIIIKNPIIPLTKERLTIILQEMELGHSLASAAASIGVSRKHIWAWRKHARKVDPDNCSKSDLLYWQFENSIEVATSNGLLTLEKGLVSDEKRWKGHEVLLKRRATEQIFVRVDEFIDAANQYIPEDKQKDFLNDVEALIES